MSGIEYDEYVVPMGISYYDFCKAKGISRPSDDMIKQWVENIRNSFYTAKEDDYIINLFGIDVKKWGDYVKQRKFAVTPIVKQMVEDKYTFIVELHLKFQEKSGLLTLVN